jgi:hypothetical protein
MTRRHFFALPPSRCLPTSLPSLVLTCFKRYTLLPPICTLTPSTTVTGSGVSHDPLVAGPGDQDGVITSVVSTPHDVATTPTGPPPGEKDYSSASDGPNDLMEVEPTCAPSIASPLGMLHDSIHAPTTAALTRPTLVNPPQGGIKSNHDSRRGGVTCEIYILIGTRAEGPTGSRSLDSASSMTLLFSLVMVARYHWPFDSLSR